MNPAASDRHVMSPRLDSRARGVVIALHLVESAARDFLDDAEHEPPPHTCDDPAHEGEHRTFYDCPGCLLHTIRRDVEAADYQAEGLANIIGNSLHECDEMRAAQKALETYTLPPGEDVAATVIAMIDLWRDEGTRHPAFARDGGHADDADDAADEPAITTTTRTA